MASVKPITPCLWFAGQAEEAAKFYTGIFTHSKITQTTQYGAAGKETHRMPVGSVLTVAFELNGSPMLALNGPPIFKFTEAVSLMVLCDDQKDIDYYWDKLTAGGDPAAQQCGWLKDKFGVSWQVAPSRIGDLVGDAESPACQRAMAVMMQMKKLDIAKLEAAYAGK